MTDKTTFDERRAHPRVPTNLQLHGSPEQGGVVARMVASNLSIGGLYCTSTTGFPEMTQLAVRLMLPQKQGNNGDTEPLDLQAVVVRNRPLDSATGNTRFELALFFTAVGDDERERLRQYLSPSVESPVSS